MRLLQASVIFAVAIVGLVNPAWGFVELDHAEPRVGSVVRAVPEAVTLFFSEPVRAGSVSVAVYNENAARVDVGGFYQDLAHPERGAIRVKNLNPGVYTVRWWATASDHDTQGRFSFTIAP